MFEILLLTSILFSMGTATPVIGGRNVGEIYVNEKIQIHNPGKYPYLVLVEISQTLYQSEFITKRNFWRCAGVLLRQDVVLTVAHCLIEAVGRPVITVRGGIVHRDLEKDIQHSFVKDYKIYLEYEEYVRPSNSQYFKGYYHTNDIALLWLEMKFTLTEKVKLAELAFPGTYYDDQMATVVGWGKTSSGYGASMLQEGDVRVISNVICQNAHKPVLVSGSMLCTLSDKRDVVHCDGDSGGPLVKNNVVIALASWTESKQLRGPNGEIIVSCDPAFPGVFTRIGEFRSWIEENINLGPPQKRIVENFELNDVTYNSHSSGKCCVIS